MGQDRRERVVPVNQILVGDALETLRTLPAESVHAVVTSPPYWGLRDYGVPGQLGLEPTPQEYVARLVEIFREVRRVLRTDGTLWMNMGDSYAGSGRGGNPTRESSTLEGGKETQEASIVRRRRNGGLHASAVDAKVIGTAWTPPPPGFKEKDLLGMPWRVALALQADGWWLRSDIVWAKPNPMPESVTDRPSKAHEYVFLLAKSERYFFDQEAVREKAFTGNHHRNVVDCKKDGPAIPPGTRPHKGLWKTSGPDAGRNLRTVWNISTEPFPEAHFATFPQALVRPCIQAGTSEHGVCGDCGAPWIRRVEVQYAKTRPNGSKGPKTVNRQHIDFGSARYENRLERVTKTLGWRKSCEHEGGPTAAVVLDPFMGSGTVALVALKAARQFIGIELNPEYAAMARRRIHSELVQKKVL